MTPLLPLHHHPREHPDAWAAAEAVGFGAAVLLDIETGPGSGLDPTWTRAISRLARSGATLIGYVDLAFAARPIPDVRAELGRWAGYPIRGIFFDQAPTSPYSIGPVAVAVRAARRIGFDTLLLNVGRPADSIYRGLGAVLSSFDGSWTDYQQDASGALPGDVHLVHSIPIGELAAARDLMRRRGARFGLATTAPVTVGTGGPGSGRPPAGAAGVSAAGSADRKMTIGS